ncbi:MAG TPA: MoaD/ThiS family protein [Thermodesulfobacteriaceae bacterium]|nr:MoaD/ThiS family protein [Thermodesulfobacteriaceae bacterium]
MWVRVKLFGGLREGRFTVKDIETCRTATVNDIVEKLGIESQEVGVTMINSRHCSMGCTLNNGDQVAIFPMIGGG